MKKHANEYEFLTVSEVATVLRTTPATVYRWNHEGTGPPRKTVGRHVLYPVREFWAWVEDRPQS